VGWRAKPDFFYIFFFSMELKCHARKRNQCQYYHCTTEHFQKSFSQTPSPFRNRTLWLLTHFRNRMFDFWRILEIGRFDCWRFFFNRTLWLLAHFRIWTLWHLAHYV
jgi:hypothetical protein